MQTVETLRVKSMSRQFAGSAIAQGLYVGRIDRWPWWKPTCNECRWLLLSGASDPPSGIVISDRKTKDYLGEGRGTFLAGVAHDLANMEAAVGAMLFNTVKDLYLTKSTALDHIRRLFDTCKGKQVKPILYYTGHGEIGTGNWCFADGTISIQEILDTLPERTYYPMIFSDACYSSHWANFCRQKNIAGFNCLAACPEYSEAIDTTGKGGDLTLFMTGKKERSDTEPVYSGENRKDFPITHGYDSYEYNDLIGSHIQNSENIVTCQSFFNGHFIGCFAPSQSYSPRPNVSWEFGYDFNSLIQWVGKNSNQMNGTSKQIYSLACEENVGFGVFFMENYGANQLILSISELGWERWRYGHQITPCVTWDSKFYVIMTKGTKEYRGRTQTWFINNTWDGTHFAINALFNKGFTVTGICYSTGRGQYFVVMTKIPEKVQSSFYFDDQKSVFNWMEEQHHVGYRSTVIFFEPTLNKFLVVMIKDNNRSSFQCLSGVKLKEAQDRFQQGPMFVPPYHGFW